MTLREKYHLGKALLDSAVVIDPPATKPLGPKRKGPGRPKKGAK